MECFISSCVMCRQKSTFMWSKFKCMMYHAEIPDVPTQVIYGMFHVPMSDALTELYVSVQYIGMYNVSCGDT